MNKQQQNKLIEYVIYIGAGYFLILKPILQKLGIEKSAEDKELESVDLIAPKNSVWSGKTFYVGGAKLLTNADATKLSKIIYDAFGFFGDDESAIIGVFRGLKTQSQVASLAQKFKEVYKTDLFTFLQKGSKSAQIYRPASSGLNASEISMILNIIKSKPKYK
jgi:DNA-binding PucR family transcriptional regulator